MTFLRRKGRFAQHAISLEKLAHLDVDKGVATRNRFPRVAERRLGMLLGERRKCCRLQGKHRGRELMVDSH